MGLWRDDIILKFTVENNNYCIRRWQRDDAVSIVSYASNRKIWLNLRDAFPHPYTASDAERFISNATENKDSTMFAIANDKESIGGIGLLAGDDVHRYSAELGYWLAEPFWGMGIMTKAVKTICEYAANELDLKRIFAEPYSFNRASAKVLEKAGFRLEGTLRSAAYKEGKFVDQFMYSLIL